MSITAAPNTEPAPADSFWLRSVRLLCACSLLAIVVPWAVMLVRDPTGRWSSLLVLLVFSPIWAPYAWVFCRLSANPDSFNIRRSLILIASWAFLVLFLSSILAFAALEAGELLYATTLAVVACLQLVLLFSSVRAYFSMPRDRADLYLLIPRLGSALLLAVSIAVLSTSIDRSQIAPNEASAVGSLRTICFAQTQFAQNHPQQGFATSLAQLGPTPGDALIDGVLASGTKNSYVFTITSTATDSQGRVTKYTVIARPIHYRKDASRSFLVDESGTYHNTAENRAPTTQDPGLQ
jgi:type IV pilus assembly protein PilA